jgi:hypothetical protein
LVENFELSRKIIYYTAHIYRSERREQKAELIASSCCTVRNL